MTRPGRVASASRPAATLERVRSILAEVREADGQPPLIQELSRRKAYQAAIKRALAEIDASKASTTSH